jgi:hypothetical protein
MNPMEPISSFTITVFTRHSGDCSKRHDPQWKRCRCRKSLYIREHGKTVYISAKTRSWEQAERVAAQERNRRDPVKIELQKIAEQRKPLRTHMKDALKLWIDGMKGPAETSIDAYRSTTRRIERWAERVGIVHVSDATPAQLDAWRASWSPGCGTGSQSFGLDHTSHPRNSAEVFLLLGHSNEVHHSQPDVVAQANYPKR